MSRIQQGIEGIRMAAGPIGLSTGQDTASWFWRMTVAAVGMTVLIFGMLVLDDRRIGAEAIWLKPFKFAVSFALLFATLALVTERLSQPVRTGLVLLLAAAGSAAAFAFEMAYIAAQAARQEASHFNGSSAFHEMMYGLMGLGATILMVAIAVVGIAGWLDRGARFAPGLRLGLGLGFGLTVVLTSWVAGELAGNDGRYIGVPTEGGPRVPVLGWSMEVGDLRPAHFLALHAMQVLPVAGILVDRFALPARTTWIVAVLYAILTVLVFLQALQGVPLISA